MSGEKKIRAILSSQHLPGDPDDAPDRMFIIRPQEAIPGYWHREAIISDVHDDKRMLVASVLEYRSRTDSPGSDIEIYIDAKVFGKDSGSGAADLLWQALEDAHKTLTDSR